VDDEAYRQQEGVLSDPTFFRALLLRLGGGVGGRALVLELRKYFQPQGGWRTKARRAFGLSSRRPGPGELILVFMAPQGGASGDLLCSRSREFRSSLDP
jgi:hypothetical protein